MKLENREDFREIKAALLQAEFKPISARFAHARNYPATAQAAQLPKPFDEGALREIVSAYTIDAYVIIESADLPGGENKKAQWLVMDRNDASELKCNLRTGARLKPQAEDRLPPHK